MAKTKWFYPIQMEVANHLKENYQHDKLGFQDVTRFRVYEVYTVVKKGETAATELVVVYCRSLNKLTAPQFYTYLRNH